MHGWFGDTHPALRWVPIPTLLGYQSPFFWDRGPWAWNTEIQYLHQNLIIWALSRYKWLFTRAGFEGATIELFGHVAHPHCDNESSNFQDQRYVCQSFNQNWKREKIQCVDCAFRIILTCKIYPGVIPSSTSDRKVWQQQPRPPARHTRIYSWQKKYTYSSPPK